jgi:hypothetical protein
MTFEQTTGTRAQVWHGTAKKTSGGLTKSALMMNKHGRIVSRKMHNTAKKENRLVKAGFLTKKGHFGFIKKGSRKHRSRKMRGGDGEDMEEEMEEDNFSTGGRRSRRMRGGDGEDMEEDMEDENNDNLVTGGRRSRRRSRRMRGGMAYGGPFSPSTYDGQGVGTSGAGLQLLATNYS